MKQVWIFKPNGEVLRDLTDPESCVVDNNTQQLVVRFTDKLGHPYVVRTTLPYLIEEATEPVKVSKTVLEQASQPPKRGSTWS